MYIFWGFFTRVVPVPIPYNTAVNISLSLSLGQHHRLGSMQWNISIIEMSVTLCVSISLIETSIMLSLDVSSTSKLPLHPSTTPLCEPRGRWGRKDVGLRSL